MERIQKAIIDAGGEVFTVGGFVRDGIMGIESKDVDFLVRKLDYKSIKEILSPLGRVFDQEVGGKVNMLKFVLDGEEFDIAIPRTAERKIGKGHADFIIDSDPFASVESDLGRRDFTINALAKDVDGNIIDKFGGLDDIKNAVIRAVGDPNDRFREDPLRMLRAIQFSARFGFNIEGKTAQAIRDNLDLFATISEERIFTEFAKAWTKGDSVHFMILLQKLDVGKAIFGLDFKPYHTASNKIIDNFVTFFLRGGDFMKMKPTNELVRHLETAKKLVAGDPDIWKWGKREILCNLEDLFDSMLFQDIHVRIGASLNLPLTMKELAVKGKDLMDMGFEGKQIGEKQVEIMKAVHDGSISNDAKEILRHLY